MEIMTASGRHGDATASISSSASNSPITACGKIWRNIKILFQFNVSTTTGANAKAGRLIFTQWITQRVVHHVRQMEQKNTIFNQLGTVTSTK
jgi:hypothetical protein